MTDCKEKYPNCTGCPIFTECMERGYKEMAAENLAFAEMVWPIACEVVNNLTQPNR